MEALARRADVGMLALGSPERKHMSRSRVRQKPFSVESLHVVVDDPRFPSRRGVLPHPLVPLRLPELRSLGQSWFFRLRASNRRRSRHAHDLPAATYGSIHQRHPARGAWWLFPRRVTGERAALGNAEQAGIARSVVTRHDLGRSIARDVPQRVLA